MGNEPCVATLPESWHVVLPTIRRETILQYSYHHRHRSRIRSTSSRSSYGGVGSSSSSSSNGDLDVDGNDEGAAEDTTDADMNMTGQKKSDDHHHDDDIFDLDEHVPTALAILTAYPHLKDVRFKLVPGVLKEERYWECIFGILNDHGNGGDENKDEGGAEYSNGKDLDEEEVDITPLPPRETPSTTGKPKPLGKVDKKLLVESPISNLGAYTTFELMTEKNVKFHICDIYIS